MPNNSDLKAAMRGLQAQSQTQIPTVSQPVIPLMEATPEEDYSTRLRAIEEFSKQAAEPVAVGRPMTEKEQSLASKGIHPGKGLSKFEKETLLFLGWKEGQPVPPNLSEHLKTVFSDYVKEKRTAGVPIEKIQISKIEDLPPEYQERAKQTLAALMRNLTPKRTATPAAPSFTGFAANEIVNIDAAPLIPTTKKAAAVESTLPAAATPVPAAAPAPIPVTETVPEVIPEPAVFAPSFTPAVFSTPTTASSYICNTCGKDPQGPKVVLYCPHCGNDPLIDPATWKIDIQDKRRFLTAIGTKRPFEKEYTMFNDTFKFRFRSLKSKEYEVLMAWVNSQKADSVAQSQYLERMASLALQVVVLETTIPESDLFWKAPYHPYNYPSLDDWKNQLGLDGLTVIVDAFRDVVSSEAVIVGLQRLLTEFNTLDYRMSVEAYNSTDFWKET
jgi:hypothetical protein